jgi:hypothetical protein
LILTSVVETGVRYSETQRFETSHQAARSESACLVAVHKHSPPASELLIEEQQVEIEKLRSALEAMPMEQAETMTMGQAENEMASGRIGGNDCHE